MKRKKKDTFDPEFIKKAARLLKGEKLSKNELQAYKLHRQVVKNYKRLKINVYRKNKQWSMDLGEMNDLAKYNYGYHYIFVCLVIYSRYAFARLLKRKSAENVKKKFDSIIEESGVTPEKIQSDEGTEFQKIRNELSKKYKFIVLYTFNREH